MGINVMRGPEGQVDPMERARDNANMARESLRNMSDHRTEQTNNNLNGCRLDIRCQQIGNGNINIGGQEGHILKTGGAGINVQKASQYLNGNNINNGFNIINNRVNNRVNGVNINARVGSSVARGPGAQNIVGGVGGY